MLTHVWGGMGGVSVTPATGDERMTRWVLAEKNPVEKGGGRVKRVRLRPGDAVVGYEFVRNGKNHVAFFESSPWPQECQPIVRSYARDLYGRITQVCTYVQAYGWRVKHDYEDIGSTCEIVGYALARYDGWEEHMNVWTPVKQCSSCRAFRPEKDLQVCSKIAYRGYNWEVCAVLFPRIRGNIAREVAQHDLIGHEVCAACRKQITVLVRSLVDLELAIAFVDEECKNVAQSHESRVTFTEATRRRLGERYRGAYSAAIGNVSRLAREAFDRERGESAGACG